MAAGRTPSILDRAGPWLAGVAVVAFFAWLAWYGYEDQRATTRSLHVIGLLRDVQTCVGLSYAANGRQSSFGEGLERIPRMKATPYAAGLEWDAASFRATAIFADTHRDYDGRNIWTAAKRDATGDLHWNCGSNVDPGARSYRNVSDFILHCDRQLSFDPGVAEYCGRFVPLPRR